MEWLKLLQHNDVIEQNFMAKLDSSNDNKKDAEEAKKKLEAAGAKVELK